MADPGQLIGTGRAADVYDIGGGRVLRRYRVPRADGVVEQEAAVMAHLRAEGYPVPEVFDASGTDVVMERVDGVTMLDDLARRPWLVDRHVATWADLHRTLHSVPVGPMAGVLPARFGPPDAVLHLDFHPGNVMLTAGGPVVFDWTNAAVGPPAADVALAWILVATSSVDGSWWMQVLANRLRRRLVDRFVDSCGRGPALAIFGAVAEHRLQDRNVRPEEAARIRALAQTLAGESPERQNAPSDM